MRWWLVFFAAAVGPFLLCFIIAYPIYYFSRRMMTRQRGAFAKQRGMSLSERIDPAIAKSLEQFQIFVDIHPIKDVLVGHQNRITYVLFDYLIQLGGGQTKWNTLMFCESDRHLSLIFGLRPKTFTERFYIPRSRRSGIYPGPWFPSAYLLTVSDAQHAAHIFTSGVAPWLQGDGWFQLEGRDHQALAYANRRVIGRRLESFVERMLGLYRAIWLAG